MLERFRPSVPSTPPGNVDKIPETISIEDFEDSPEIYALLKKIPSELRIKHMNYIEELSDPEGVEYLQKILEDREKAISEAYVSDDSIREYFDGHSAEIWKSLETNVFTDPNNLLGHGKTARVKSFHIENAESPIPPFAIKYLVTPMNGTLDVAGEHNLIKEVERIQQIEQSESELEVPLKYLKVPHPYFYYRHGKTQLYGMEEVDGINLEKAESGQYDSELKNIFREKFGNIDQDELAEEIDRFLDAMHAICLHGDIKPRNLMVSREGKFYVIDFGQSVLTSNINDKAMDAFENLKDDEKAHTKAILLRFVKSLTA